MDALRDALRQIGRFRGKRCVLITDMKGSTAIFSEEGDMAAVTIQRQRDLLMEEIGKVGGTAWAVGGDGILAFFEASRDALKAVVEIQKRIKEEKFSVRAGLHAGNVFLDPNMQSQTINIASRIMSLADGGQILTSSATYQEAREIDFARFHSHGEYSLKGILEPIEVYEMLWYKEQETKSPPKEIESPPIDNIPFKAYRDLIGRSRNVDEVMSALSDPKGKWLIVIDGIGGIGKTALAREVIDICLNKGLFEKVIWESAKEEVFVQESIERKEILDITFNSLLDSIARQLGLLDILKLKDNAKEMALKHILTSKRILIVIDNLETIKEYEFLVDCLRVFLNPSKILFTSRYKLKNVYVYPISLTGLSEDDSLTFLRYESRERNIHAAVNADTSSLKKICQNTGGLPLAMKLVVGQLTRLSLKDVLDSLEKVKVGGEYEEFYRFIYWSSWNILSSDAKKMLISLSHFTFIGGDKKAILRVSGIDEQSFNKCIDELWTMSLVEIGGAIERRRYSLHPLTRYFVLSDLVRVWG